MHAVAADHQGFSSLFPLPIKTLFLVLQRGLGPYSFIIFSGVCLATFIYIWMVVQETKNKTFLEISQMFAKKNKVEIKQAYGDEPLKGSEVGPEDVLSDTAF